MELYKNSARGKCPCDKENKMAKRKRSELSKATDRRLKTYTVAAIAAGVGALALAQPAEGEKPHYT